MIKVLIQTGLIVLILISCVPDTPTGSISDPLTVAFIVEKPSNFSLSAKKGALQVDVSYKNPRDITGYKIYSLSTPILNEDLEVDLGFIENSTSFNSNLATFSETLYLQSYVRLTEELGFERDTVIYSDPVSAEFVQSISRLNFHTSSWDGRLYANWAGDVLLSTDLIFEYSPDSLNFFRILDNTQDRNRFNRYRIIHSGFYNRFERDISGIFRYKLVTESEETDYFYFDNDSISNCTEKDEIEPSEILLNGTNYSSTHLSIKWSLPKACIDQIQIFQINPTTNDREIVEISNRGTTSINVLRPKYLGTSTRLQLGFIRYGEEPVLSEVSNFVYNNQWVKQ